MKLLLLALLALSSCASNPQHARYEQEKNAPKFGNTRTFVEKPDEVSRAARAALDQLNRESDPPVASSVKGDDDNLSSGWVYEISPSKYVEFQENGMPSRKPLRIRRKYTYGISPSLSGSQVTMGVEEEEMKLNFKTGEDDGWSSTAADPAAFDKMTKLLREQIRERKN